MAPDLPFSPAADRNKEPILRALAALLAADARILELASGTGQHAAHFAAAQRGWSWQPTDGDPSLLAAIGAHCRGLTNVQGPLPLDVMSIPWPVPRDAFDAVYCANLIHISPWPAGLALLRGAAVHLAVGGVLVLYGPFIVEGVATVPSNLAFDADLRARDPRWGLRRLSAVAEEAALVGLRFERRVELPANNLLLVFRRSSVEPA